jgi:hypothetical protein
MVSGAAEATPQSSVAEPLNTPSHSKRRFMARWTARRAQAGTGRPPHEGVGSISMRKLKPTCIGRRPKLGFLYLIRTLCA